MNTEGSSWNLAAALERLYRRTLWIYPAGFRRAFGREMTEAFRDSCLDVRRRGRVRLLLHGLHALGELFFQGVLERSLLLGRAARGAWAGGQASAGHASAGTRSPGRRGAGVALESVQGDVRFGLRLLRRRPLFTGVAVLTLGLGIGTTTAMFSITEGVLLRQLPYERPGELVTVWKTFPEWLSNEQLASMWDMGHLAYPDYERWRALQTMYVDVAIYGDTDMTITGNGPPERLFVGLASASLLPVLGVRPELGRFFLLEEEGRGAARVAVLSHAFWAERFGSDPEVLGEIVTVNDMPFTVVGVLPASFRLRALGMYGEPGERPLWIPVGADGASLDAGNHAFEAVARLKPGVSPVQASEETDALIRGDLDPSLAGARLEPRDSAESAGLQAPLVLLLAASFVLLVIACGNVSLLLLGEVTRRRKEITTRAALGAGVRRITRQLLTESVLLGLTASVLGALLAVAGTRLIVTMAPPIPRLDEVGVNGTVFLFAVIVGVATSALFGVVPSLGLSQKQLHGVLRGSGLGGDRRELFSQRLVVSLEIALTVVLLISAGLLARSLAKLLATDPGFRQEYLAEVRIELPMYRGSRYADRHERLFRLQEIRAALGAVPGVTAVSGASSVPFSDSDTPPLHSLEIDGWDSGGEASSPHAVLRSVFPGYIETLGIPLLAGRTISEQDREVTSGVVVISESMARRFWPRGFALGARIPRGGFSFTVIGIVGDVRHESMDAEILPTMYFSALQVAPSEMSFVVKTALEPESLLLQLREAVWSVASDVPVTRTTTVAALVAQSARDERFRTMVLGIFGICATLLAASGVFGVAARSVTQRSREFAIRMALGAREHSLVGLALREVSSTSLVGTALGLIGAFWVSRLLARFLFGVEPSDPLTYGAVCALAILVCGIATYVPARRITRVNPVDVLRAE